MSKQVIMWRQILSIQTKNKILDENVIILLRNKLKLL